jgi:hypothetical protein
MGWPVTVAERSKACTNILLVLKPRSSSQLSKHHLSWPQKQMGVNAPLHIPIPLYLGETVPGTHWIGGWVGGPQSRSGCYGKEKKLAPVFARSEAGIVGSNPTQGMDVWCLCAFFCVCVVLCLGRGLATSWSPVKGVLPSVKWSRNWEVGPMLQSGSKRRNIMGWP